MDSDTSARRGRGAQALHEYDKTVTEITILQEGIKKQESH
jgi:hypothetical protein